MLLCILQSDKPVDGWLPSPRRYSDTIELGIYRSHSFDPNLFNIREVSPDKIAVSDAPTHTYFSIMYRVNVQEVVYMYVVWKCTCFGSCIHVRGFGSVHVLEVVYMYVVWKCTCFGSCIHVRGFGSCIHEHVQIVVWFLLTKYVHVTWDMCGY